VGTSSSDPTLDRDRDHSSRAFNSVGPSEFPRPRSAPDTPAPGTTTRARARFAAPHRFRDIVSPPRSRSHAPIAVDESVARVSGRGAVIEEKSR
jgi:hypothetical protein